MSTKSREPKTQLSLLPSEYRATDLAYLAGIMDGEGSINTQHVAKHKYTFIVRIQVSMCDIGAIALLSQLFGGKIITRAKRSKGGRQVFQWALNSKNAANVLELLLPYLIVKRERALNAIALAKMSYGRGGGRYRQLSNTEIAERFRLANAIQSENFSRRPTLYGVKTANE